MSLHVAAYCRVSTDREDQANSLQSQQSYFRTYIENHENWLLADIYADEGLSGTSTHRRGAFHRMIQDAEAGRFDLILTKEVSRFARNTIDTLEYTRKLKHLGVGVLFISDNIDTRDNDGELRLTIMASMAQEESRKTSERVKWGQKRRMEAGVVFGNNSTYGFITEKGTLTVKADEARVIQRIYHKFLNEHKGTHVIARELYEEGLPPPRTATGKWSCVMIRRILRNEKYVGDLLQKKFITLDYLTHKKEENKGREETVYLRNHHEAIVDRATWEAAQDELARRNTQQVNGSKHSNRYWCSGKIYCGTCGSRFVLRTTKRSNGDTYRTWGCHSRVHYGNWKQNGQGDYVGCNMRMVNNKTLTTCVQAVLQQLEFDYSAIVAELIEAIKKIQAVGRNQVASERLAAQQTALAAKKERVMDAYFSQTISKEEMLQIKGRYDEQLERLGKQLYQLEAEERSQREHCVDLDDRLKAICTHVDTSEEVFRAVIEYVVVYEAYLTVCVYFLPVEFRLWYHTSGTKEGYTTTIERCEVLPREPFCNQ